MGIKIEMKRLIESKSGSCFSCTSCILNIRKGLLLFHRTPFGRSIILWRFQEPLLFQKLMLLEESSLMVLKIDLLGTEKKSFLALLGTEKKSFRLPRAPCSGLQPFIRNIHLLQHFSHFVPPVNWWIRYFHLLKTLITENLPTIFLTLLGPNYHSPKEKRKRTKGGQWESSKGWRRLNLQTSSFIFFVQESCNASWPYRIPTWLSRATRSENSLMSKGIVMSTAALAISA